MTLFSLVWKYLVDRKLNTALNILMLALGIAVMTVLILFNKQLEERVSSNAKGIDLVVGAKGSPLQLILCSIFHVDFPTGNIKLADAEMIARHKLVKKSIPMALGDSYAGFRIVGTSRDYAEFYHAEIQSGDWWKDGLEVTIGNRVAEATGLKPGDEFESAHGLSMGASNHEDHHFRVTGVLSQSNTVIDNLILTNVASMWEVHDLHGDSTSASPLHPSTIVPGANAGDSTREITSLLIQFRNPLAVIQLPRIVNGIGNLQSASPAFETARLFTIMGVGVDVLRGFGYLLLFISGLSIFIALYNSLRDRRYDMAIMRSMGAGRKKLFASILMEGTLLTLMGSFLGIALGHGAVAIFATATEEGARAGMSAVIFYSMEGLLLAGSLLLGIACSIVPAIQVYRTDIHKVLAGI